MKIVAFSNNDVALAAWTFDHKLVGCLGFAVYRIDVNAGTETCLPALATFPKEVASPNRTTAQDPVQKFFWKDPYAVRGGLYKYKIVPLTGSPGNLVPMPIGPLVSNPVSLTPQRGLFSAYFNRGILATQATAMELGKGKAGPIATLLANIALPGNPLRLRLAGQMIEALLSLLQRAEKEKGDCYCALYELEDDELVLELQKLSGRLHIVLSNLRGKNDPDVDKKYRAALQTSGADKYDRILNNGQIGHNKFVVYVKGQTPQAVLFGSTNWTFHGLCAQTNNSLVVESPILASAYYAQWKRLKQDTLAAKQDPKAFQGPALRKADGKSAAIQIEDKSASMDLWFSPNTPKLRPSKPAKNEVAPGDMAQVFQLIQAAKHSVLFLAFQPGTPSIIDPIAKAQAANPSLFVRGALTNSDAAGKFYTDLHGLIPKKRKKGDPPAKQDARVISALGVKDAFYQWQKELNQAGHAVIHDKIVVIDAFTPDCIVITGSHNLGYRASYNNDENLAIIRGHRPLSEAYATHVLDVYDHYSWRYWLQVDGKKAFHMLDTSDKWQDKYFDSSGQVKGAQLRFWLSAEPSMSVNPSAPQAVAIDRAPVPVTPEEIQTTGVNKVHLVRRGNTHKKAKRPKRKPRKS